MQILSQVFSEPLRLLIEAWVSPSNAKRAIKPLKLVKSVKSISFAERALVYHDGHQHDPMAIRALKEILTLMVTEYDSQAPIYSTLHYFVSDANRAISPALKIHAAVSRLKNQLRSYLPPKNFDSRDYNHAKGIALAIFLAKCSRDAFEDMSLTTIFERDRMIELMACDDMSDIRESGLSRFIQDSREALNTYLLYQLFISQAIFISNSHADLEICRSNLRFEFPLDSEFLYSCDLVGNFSIDYFISMVMNYPYYSLLPTDELPFRVIERLLKLGYFRD